MSDLPSGLVAAEEPTRFWDSPWGFDKDSPPPELRELFPPTPDEGDRAPSSWAMEDFLQHNAVFYNLLSGNTCHSDSYMTGVAYGNLKTALDALDEQFSPTADDWYPLVEEWLCNPNQQPPLRFVAIHVSYRYGIKEFWHPSELARENETAT
jgi:hypothetical protein